MTSDFRAPRKSLGQNFLQDQNIIRKIVASLSLKPDDVVVEIGPGRGALTESILTTAHALHVIEFDRDLAEYWRRRAPERLTVHESDVLKFDFSNLPKAPVTKVIGNLPYNISSPILFHLLNFADQIALQIVMLQKEVVDRMIASPGNKQYGRLSVMLQYRYGVEKLFTVPPTAFFPAPKVDSAIIKMTPHAVIEQPVDDVNDLELLVKQAFSQRRKTIRNNLKSLLSAEQIIQVNIDPSARAETLTVAQFAQLSNLYSKSKGQHLGEQNE